VNIKTQDSLGFEPKRTANTQAQIAEHIASLGMPVHEASLLAELLTVKRPANSAGAAYAANLILSYLNKYGVDAVQDECGNIIADMRNDACNTVLFSAHYDTAHDSQTSGSFENKVHINPTNGYLQGVDACIGADDAAGIIVLFSLISAEVPALYIIHASEEVGGIGSRYIADNTPELLDGITHAIAFDRRGTNNVIWMQSMQACASEGCAGVIAHALNMANRKFDYAPDDNGSFTDTKVYRNIIPECFNISCGYDNEHWSEELLDVGHLVALCEAVQFVGWHDLPVWRSINEQGSSYNYGFIDYNRDTLARYVYPSDAYIESFDSWDEFFAADFNTAIDHAYDVCHIRDADIVDFLIDSDDPEQHRQVLDYLNLNYPLNTKDNMYVH
jgi:hypothetical protein